MVMPFSLVVKMDALLVQAVVAPLQVTAQLPQALVPVDEVQAMLLATLAWHPTLLPKLLERRPQQHHVKTKKESTAMKNSLRRAATLRRHRRAQRRRTTRSTDEHARVVNARPMDYLARHVKRAQGLKINLQLRKKGTAVFNMLASA